MEGAGLTPVFCSLFPRPTRQKGEDGLKNWILTFLKKPFEGLVDGVRDEIIAEAESRLRAKLYKDGQWFIDYVRIRIKAVKK